MDYTRIPLQVERGTFFTLELCLRLAISRVKLIENGLRKNGSSTLNASCIWSCSFQTKNDCYYTSVSGRKFTVLTLSMRQSWCFVEMQHGSVLKKLSLLLLAITRPLSKLDQTSSNKTVPRCNSSLERMLKLNQIIYSPKEPNFSVRSSRTSTTGDHLDCVQLKNEDVIYLQDSSPLNPTPSARRPPQYDKKGLLVMVNTHSRRSGGKTGDCEQSSLDCEQYLVFLRFAEGSAGTREHRASKP